MNRPDSHHAATISATHPSRSVLARWLKERVYDSGKSVAARQERLRAQVSHCGTDDNIELRFIRRDPPGVPSDDDEPLPLTLTG